MNKSPTGEGSKKKQRQFDFFRYPKRRIALMFLYYGWEYDGLVQQQDTDNTVEAAMEAALLKTRLIEAWSSCEWRRSGRTDKGVSAFHQVASLIVRSTDPEGQDVFWGEDSDPHSRITPPHAELCFVKMLNGVLPATIRVLAWAPIDENFSARFACTRRTYLYAFPVARFDIEAIRRACALLRGEHDFRNICRIDHNKARLNMTYIRTIHDAQLCIVSEDGQRRSVDESADTRPFSLVELRLTASGFLWHQIRCVVALLYEIGEGNEQPEVITALLDIDKTPRKPTYDLAPSSPLCLFDCSYEGASLCWEWDIPSLNKIKTQLLVTWADLQTRAHLMRSMVQGLDEMIPGLSSTCEGLSAFLRPRGAPRVYVPLNKRATCDGLEEKRAKLRLKDMKRPRMQEDTI